MHSMAIKRLRRLHFPELLPLSQAGPWNASLSRIDSALLYLALHGFSYFKAPVNASDEYARSRRQDDLRN